MTRAMDTKIRVFMLNQEILSQSGCRQRRWVKKLLGIVVLGLLSFNSIKTFSFVKLEEYLATNSTEDPSVSIYTFNRCAALSQFMSAISYERDKNLSKKY